MKYFLVTAAMLIGTHYAVGVTPVQKVIVLLEGMLQKGKTDMHDEQTQFATYKQFCDDTAREKQGAVKDGGEKIEMLKADIQKYTADAARLGREIGEHDADIATWKGDQKAADKVRILERSDYDDLHRDYSESVDALHRAIAVLKKQGYNRPQASLTQVAALKDLSLIPVSAKRTIAAFLSEVEAVDPSEHLDVSAPEAHGYEFQSHGIIDMMEKLLDKFIDERTGIEKKEMNSRHAFEILQQDLKAQIADTTRDKTDKEETKASILQAKADAEGDLVDATTTRDADSKYLSELTATCEGKGGDFESRQQLRADEIATIQKAIAILSGDAVSSAAAKHLPALFQNVRRSTSLAQLRVPAASADVSVSQKRMAKYLQQRAKEIGSRVLLAVAAHAGDDPFRKVKKMLKDLITRLMEEANSEATHKGWCDTELSTNAQTRQAKTQAVELLHAEVDQLQTSIAQLSEDIVRISKQLADAKAALAETTQLRQEEKAANDATLSDAREAQTALAQAIVVLQEFYATAAEATALVQQQQQPASPEIFDTPYKGMQAEHGGVVAMLQVIQSDFARLETETSEVEAQELEHYNSFVIADKIRDAQLSTDLAHQTAKRQDQERALITKSADLEGTQKELDAALAYFDKLKPSCVDAGVSYDDRVERRKEEIQSLQEALRILNGEDIP